MYKTYKNIYNTYNNIYKTQYMEPIKTYIKHINTYTKLLLKGIAKIVDRKNVRQIEWQLSEKLIMTTQADLDETWPNTTTRTETTKQEARLKQAW